jgi:2-polyprenyl-3-methyl-5-hydroxy-6-metoxy-1,4-benzoquinol methylase
MLSELMKQFKGVDVSKMRADAFLQRQDELERLKIRGIEEHSGWKDVPACPLCGSSERAPEFPKHGVDLFRCLGCSVHYGGRIAADLNDVYRNPGYVVYSKEDSEEHFNYRRERFGRERVGILEKYCGDLSEKRLLDVGCGNGYFLSVAVEKCRHCFGTEFSDRLRAFAREKTGRPIFHQRLEDLPETGFDIITLFDVIEHLPEPVPFMRQVDRLLNPGGVVLLFTPNFDSFSIRVMREASSIVDPTEHVVLYTLPSLRYLAGMLGHEVIYAETQGMDILNILSMLQSKGEPAPAFLLDWHDGLQAMINAAQCGDYARILFRKHGASGRAGERPPR